MTLLVLWDIDGTLLRRAADAHAAALHVALEEVFGVTGAAGVGVPTAGRTDLEIAREVVELLGVDPAAFDPARDRLVDAWVRAHDELCADSLADRVVPGIPELLGELAASGRVRHSLVTGNLEPIGRLKLGRAGIGHHFEAGQGGFGSDSERRVELPALARRRAAAGDGGEPHPRERTLVVGDTPLDVACARADGIRVLGVTTGRHGREDLATADAVADDAGELRGLLAAELDRAGVPR